MRQAANEGHIKLLYFAAVSDAVGKSAEALVLPETVKTIAELRAHLAIMYPALVRGLPSVRFARNEVFVEENELVAPGDVVALIPPVAGG